MNSSNYPRAVAQIDQTACWAAGLDWWLGSMSPGRSHTSQLNLINQFAQYWNHNEESPDYGTVTADNLVKIMASPTIRMQYIVKRGTFDKSFIGEKLAISPVLIGYYETEVAGFHINIIHSLNPDGSANGDANVMDPNRGRYRSRGGHRFTTRDYLLGWAA